MIPAVGTFFAHGSWKLLMTALLKDYYLSGELEPILNSRQRTEERKPLERNKELCIHYYY